MTPRTAFLVARTSLSACEGPLPSLSEDHHYQPLEAEDHGPVRVPEVVFLTRAAAERERGRRERAARELLNPFWLGPLVDTSSLLEADFRTRVTEIGLTPPPPEANQYDSHHLVAWWDQEHPGWSEEQCTGVWELLDKMQLFEIIEVELE